MSLIPKIIFIDLLFQWMKADWYWQCLSNGFNDRIIGNMYAAVISSKSFLFCVFFWGGGCLAFHTIHDE